MNNEDRQWVLAKWAHDDIATQISLPFNKYTTKSPSEKICGDFLAEFFEK
jgi:hypothetical protein